MRSAVELRDRQASGSAVLGLVLVGVYVGVLGWGVDRLSYDVLGALLIAPVLVAVSVPILVHATRHEDDPWITRLIVWALVLKLAASLARYYVAYEVYGGSADATAYINNGARLAESFRQGIFTVDVGRGVVGTGFIRILTGLVFTVTGRTGLGGFLVFSWFGFWGLYFFYRAFRVACPDGDRRRYALLVFFLPSMLFWPSSVGKESWMLLGLGLSAYGAARILTRARGGYLLLGLGLLATGMVRPHMSALVCAGLVVGYLLRRSRGRPSAFGPVARIAGVVVLLAVSVVVLKQTEQFFGGDEEQIAQEGTAGAGEESTGSGDPFNRALDEAEHRTGEGVGAGSAYDAERVRSPLQLPKAIISVLFRPFPFEAHNLQALIASLEGTALLGLILLAVPRLRSLLGELFRSPYVMFAAVYTLLFVVAFSTFGNFGILTRQRVQVYPLVFVFLALPRAAAAATARWRAYN